MTAPHIALSTSYQSMSALGPRRKYILETTDTACVIGLVAGSSTGDATNGVYILDKNGRPVVLRGDRPEHMTAHVEDPSQAVKYILIAGTVTGGVYCDGEATSVQVQASNAAYTPAVGGDYTGAPTDIAAAADELASRVKAIEVSDKTAQGIIRMAPHDFILATGAPMAVFANGASSVPGLSLTDSKALCVRWNNNATLDAILASFHMPPDADITANMVLHARASKTGATLGDAVTFLVAAYNQVDGALHDADTNFGGTSNAMTGNATAKTIQNVTLTLGLADLAAHPASVTLTIKPTDGTLGTDDLCLEEVYILYTKKLLTS